MTRAINDACHTSLHPDAEPIAAVMVDLARRQDAEKGSRELLERQVWFHQYPCKIAGEA